MEALKFELFAELAVFKTPFSVKGIETFPLPPYSTIIGFIYNALGEKYGGERFGISVSGTHEGILRDYLTLRKYNRKDKLIEKKPIEVPFLFNFRLVCHLVGDKELLERFEEALKRPKTYLGLGVAELPAKVVRVKRVSFEESVLRRTTPLKRNFFIPKGVAENLELRSAYGQLEPENLEGGIEFVVPSFLKKMEPYRDYFFEEVLFVPEGFKLARGSKVWVDKEGDFLFPTEVLDGAKNAV